MFGFKRNNVPKQETLSLQHFCSGISPEKAVYLDYTDTRYGYQATHCYDNIRHYIKHHGGEAVYGWIIWKDTDFPFEAEHHAVWKSPSGKLFDITPRVDGEPQILFLPDPSRPYDFKYTWLNRHNTDPILFCVYRGAITKEEKVLYTGKHPYHDWIKKLPGNPENALEK